MDGKMNTTGCFVSDLHLLASRSSGARYYDDLHNTAAQSCVFVLGGDIFDFHWADTPIEYAAWEAAHWLRDLAHAYPRCQFHYLLGNHDHNDVFIERLIDLDRQVPNLTWDHHYLRLGSKIFLHGDVLGRNVTAETLTAERTRLHHHRVREVWEHQFYDLAVSAGLHKPVPFVVHPTRIVARKLLRHLRRIGHGPEAGVRDVYFGHIHRVITNYTYRGVRFHSGGAAIRGLQFRILQFPVELPDRRQSDTQP